VLEEETVDRSELFGRNTTADNHKTHPESVRTDQQRAKIWNQ